ncbi:MAG: class I SAM-dependent methyltransferase [Candidatus Firestonebacteria bacterium]
MDKPDTQRNTKIREFIRIKFLSKPLQQTRIYKDLVLDIGCGWGFYFKINPYASGIDLDDKCVNYLEEKGYKVIKADILNKFPFDGGTFEWVIAHDIFEHFELNEVKNIFTETHRILKDKGKFLIVIPNQKGYNYGCRINAGHKHFITPEEIAKISKETFIVKKSYSYPLNRFLGEHFTHNKEVLILEKK